MEKLNRGDKIYLDKENTVESAVNTFLDCRDGIVHMVEYHDTSGYGCRTRFFYCINAKHEYCALIRQVNIDNDKGWREESMFFDSDSFEFVESLINLDIKSLGNKYTLVRDY